MSTVHSIFPPIVGRGIDTLKPFQYEQPGPMAINPFIDSQPERKPDSPPHTERSTSEPQERTAYSR